MPTWSTCWHFRHCHQINLSDTQVSNAGLIHLSKMDGQQWLDLSRTRVTDLSVLFGDTSFDQPSSIKLSGNRIARLKMPRLGWSPLLHLDLSDTDADDATLESLPGGWINLKNLDLCGTNVSDDGLLSVLRIEGLMKLNLMDTKVTAAGVARMKSRWRFGRPLTIVTGTRKKAGGARKNTLPQGTSGGPAQPIPLLLKDDVPAPGSRRS